MHPRYGARSEAVLAAQPYPRDAFTVPLIHLATTGSGVARIQAIHAIVHHRTDAGVEALRALLRDPDPAIRQETARAIRRAYEHPGGAGRPLLLADFPELVKPQ